MHGGRAHKSKPSRPRCLLILVRDFFLYLFEAIIAPKKIGKDFSFPKPANIWTDLLLVELDRIAYVYRLQREYDHSRRGRWGSPGDYNFSNPSPRHLASIDDRPVPTVEHAGIGDYQAVRIITPGGASAQ